MLCRVGRCKVWAIDLLSRAGWKWAYRIPRQTRFGSTARYGPGGRYPVYSGRRRNLRAHPLPVSRGASVFSGMGRGLIWRPSEPDVDKPRLRRPQEIVRFKPRPFFLHPRVSNVRSTMREFRLGADIVFTAASAGLVSVVRTKYTAFYYANSYILKHDRHSDSNLIRNTSETPNLSANFSRLS